MPTFKDFITLSAESFFAKTMEEIEERRKYQNCENCAHSWHSWQSGQTHFDDGCRICLHKRNWLSRDEYKFGQFKYKDKKEVKTCGTCKFEKISRSYVRNKTGRCLMCICQNKWQKGGKMIDNRGGN